jgi:hypothetical protein
VCIVAHRAREQQHQAPWLRRLTKRPLLWIAWNLPPLTRSALDSRALHLHMVRLLVPLMFVHHGCDDYVCGGAVRTLEPVNI